ncbi:hypothetical protein [Kitasatospora sp. NPDC007106]|uniref:hypothetical protein n=1 Tax=Kitasatospora sp. NPDC007106 TaxID=3156914 RepID=UPI00340D8210
MSVDNRPPAWPRPEAARRSIGIAHGKGGEIASNRRDEQEMFMLCLCILQSAWST